MATTNLNIRTDSELKKRAEAVFAELGLNMSSAVNMFLRAAVRENGIPFTLKMDRAPVYELPQEEVRKTVSRKKTAVKKTAAKPAARKAPAQKNETRKKADPADITSPTYIDEIINSLND